MLGPKHIGVNVAVTDHLQFCGAEGGHMLLTAVVDDGTLSHREHATGVPLVINMHGKCRVNLPVEQGQVDNMDG